MDKAKETFLKIFNNIKDRWLSIGKTTRVIVLSVIGAVIIALIVLNMILSQTGYSPLFTDISDSEVEDVTKFLRDTLQIEYRVSGNTISVPDDVKNTAFMELAMEGYPRSNWNYNLWDEGVGMLSTDAEKTEKQRQQLAENISACIETFSPVKRALVIISPLKTQNYVLVEDKQELSVAVTLTLRDGEKLTSKQIDGIYYIVESSLAGLERENVKIVDNNNGLLVPDEAPTGAESLSLEIQKYKAQLEFKQTMENDTTDSLKLLLKDAYQNFSVRVAVELDYGTEVVESIEYSAPNIDENGNQTGIISDSTRKSAAGGTAAEGGVIGTAPNADISPDFPTIEAQVGNDVFYESLEELKFKVNETKRQYQSNSFVVKKISCAVIIDSTAMTQQQIDDLRNNLANALGTNVEFVSVMAQVFPLNKNVQNSATGLLPSTNRNMLIFVIIALGALLVILLFLAIMTSGSKKRRHVKSRLAAASAAASGNMGGPGYNEDMFGSVTATKVTGAEEREEDFGITSLLADEGESRESVLKNEIREFAKTNPDIVAQLIRTWMKE